MVNFQSGLLGISETSSDMQDLLKIEREDVRAAEAVALFCYQVKKWIGAFAAALGGLDTLVFAGGIGENAPAVRGRICDGLGFLGIRLEEKRNANNSPVISAQGEVLGILTLAGSGKFRGLSFGASFEEAAGFLKAQGVTTAPDFPRASIPLPAKAH